MPRQLSGLDATFLEAETETALMHAVGLIRFDPEGGPLLDVEELVGHLEARMNRLEPLRRRLVSVPGGLDQPWWITVAPDLRAHLSQVHLAEGSDDHDLERLCAEIAETPLPRDRPLWHFWLVDGLTDGTQALIAKLHHSVSDGVGSLAIVAGLLDPEPGTDAGGPEGMALPDEADPGAAWLLARAAIRRLRWPFDAARTGLEVGASTLRLARLGRTPHADMALPLRAPRLAMSGVVSAGRSVALRELPLDRLKDVAHEAGMHLNDVILATIAGGLRRWLSDHDDLPDHALVAAVPVSLRTATELGDAGNKVSACFVHLATHLAHPLDRLRASADAATGGKAAHLAVGPHTIEHFTSLVFPNLVTTGIHTYFRLGMARMHPPPVNLVASNVAGPPMPLYLAGRHVVSLSALGPIFDGVPLNITVISYNGRLAVGYLACPERIPDLESLADHTLPAFEELADAVAATR